MRISDDFRQMPFDVLNEHEHWFRFIDDRTESWWFQKARKYGIGIGDFCYTVGLFRVLAGNKRNLPVVHFGTIARTIEDEAFPIKDWRDPEGKRTIQTEAYLVESQSLSGLSGAPVFVRSTLNETGHFEPPDPMGDVAIAMRKIHLIGVWQGSWDAPPGEVLGAERGKTVRVPVGMGVVLPIDHVHAILESDELKTMRHEAKSVAG